MFAINWGHSALELLWSFLRPAPWWNNISFNTLRADAIAGITGAAIVLPQGVAFAAIAGLPPEYGFYAALVPSIIAALFGSSLHMVTGPTSAISALVFSTLSGIHEPGSAEFIESAITMAFLVGIFQIILGLARMGMLTNFVSHSVMVGFSAGAAVLIIMSQIRYAAGVNLPRPEKLIEFTSAAFQSLNGLNYRSLFITVIVVTTALSVRLVSKRVPNYLVALIVGGLAGFLVDGSGGSISYLGALPSVAPVFSIPNLSTSTIGGLADIALAVALVGLLEAVSVSKVIAIKSGQTLDVNREFVAQGMANTVGSFFSSYSCSGSFTRSGLNYEAGAQTPLSAIMSSVFLLFILLLVAPLFAYLPIPAMAGVIMVVAWKLINFSEIRHIIMTSRSELAIASVTFITTLAIDLKFSIYSGVMLSLAIFLKKTTHPYLVIGAPDHQSSKRVFRNAEAYNLPECPQLVVTRLDGPLYFASIEHLQLAFHKIQVSRPAQKHMLIILQGVGEIDMSGANLIIQEGERRLRMGGSLHIVTRFEATRHRLEKYHVPASLGYQNMHENKGSAISSIIERLDHKVCSECQLRIFVDCPRPESPH